MKHSTGKPYIIYNDNHTSDNRHITYSPSSADIDPWYNTHFNKKINNQYFISGAIYPTYTDVELEFEKLRKQIADLQDQLDAKNDLVISLHRKLKHLEETKP